MFGRFRISLEARAIFATVLGAVGVVSMVLGFEDIIERLPAVILAAAAGVTALLAFLSVIFEQRKRIAALETREREQQVRDTARRAFDDRIEEGNELARRLKRYKPGRDVAGLTEDRAVFKKEVGAWNARCVETAREYTGVAGILGAPMTPLPSPASGRTFWRDHLLHEVTEKIIRLEKMQSSL